MPLDLAVRPATPADGPELTRLAELAVAELRGERGGELWARREGAWLQTGADPVSPPTASLLVGTLDEVVVGAAVLEVQLLDGGAHLGLLRGIYVEPEARELGVGELLMTEVLALAATATCEGVDSFVLPGNRAAKNFFEAHGLVARGIVVHRHLHGEQG